MIDKNEKITYIFPCHFGLEKILKTELKNLGYNISDVCDGEVKVTGTIMDVPRLNYNLRTCERVMIEVTNFSAKLPDDLYNGALNTKIEKFVPVDGEFVIVKANQDKNSMLKSSKAIQKTVKKAFVERLKKAYETNSLLEIRGKYPFRVKFYKNTCSIRLDTTGDSLHKRGYRIKSGRAPIEETLASALIKLIVMKRDTVLLDPFCGSGTIPIEAAMIACSIPPSIDRAFVSETWDIIDRNLWKEEREIAINNVDKERLNDKNIKIFGFDIDSDMIAASKDNAKRAGVDNLIKFKTKDVKYFAEDDDIKKFDEIIILTNPPYGERLNDKDTILTIYKDLKNSFVKLDNAKLNIITSFDGMRDIFGKEIKNRKVYNGMLKTYLYSYDSKYM